MHTSLFCLESDAFQLKHHVSPFDSTRTLCARDSELFVHHLRCCEYWTCESLAEFEDGYFVLTMHELEVLGMHANGCQRITLIYNIPCTLQECSTFLFNNETHNKAVKPCRRTRHWSDREKQSLYLQTNFEETKLEASYAATPQMLGSTVNFSFVPPTSCVLLLVTSILLDIRSNLQEIPLAGMCAIV